MLFLFCYDVAVHKNCNDPDSYRTENKATKQAKEGEEIE